MKKSYQNFIAMIISSGILMYGLMFLNTYAFEHVFFSEMRLYMTFLSSSIMTLVMFFLCGARLKTKRKILRLWQSVF